MRFATLTLAALAVLASASANAADGGLAGVWEVDLSTNPAEPYTKEMVLVLADDGTVSGSFYDSTIEGGQWKTDRGRTCASFRTSDGLGPYHSSVCLGADGSTATGQTWAEQRTFLFNWNATRKAGGE